MSSWTCAAGAIGIHLPHPSAQAQGTTAPYLARLYLGTRSQGRTGGLNHLSKPGSKHLYLASQLQGIIDVRSPHPSILVPGTTDGRPTYSPSCVPSGSAVRLPSTSKSLSSRFGRANWLQCPSVPCEQFRARPWFGRHHQCKGLSCCLVISAFAR
jgi:hypothetical protein